MLLLSASCSRRTRRCVGAAIDACGALVDGGARVAGPVMWVLALSVMAGVTLSYFAHVLPALLDAHGSVHALSVTALGIWLLVNLVFHFLAASLGGPGFAPLELDAAVLAALARDPDSDRSRGPGDAFRFCKKCNAPKPMRAHHCSVCRRCVLKMDHHCPWINACVGYRNQRHFVLFLVYLEAASLFFLASSAPLWYGLLSGGPLGAPSDLFLVAVLVTLSAVFAAGLFALWTLYLTLSNQTTIEFYNNRFPLRRPAHVPRGFNPFAQGLRRNWESVFGPVHWRGLLSLLLPVRVAPPGDGLTFPVLPFPPEPPSPASTPPLRAAAAPHPPPAAAAIALDVAPP